LAKVFFFAKKWRRFYMGRSHLLLKKKKKKGMAVFLLRKKAKSHIEGYLASLVTILRQSVLDNF